jgi:hypothetical protein
MAKIEELFFLPPMAVARLGGSDTPLVSYTWLEDPSLHGAGLTVISPSTSLEVLADGGVRPFLPAGIQFRDGDKFRPVAPFLELWVRSNGTEPPVPVILSDGLTVRARGFPVLSVVFAWGHEGTHILANVNNSLLGTSGRPSLF